MKKFIILLIFFSSLSIQISKSADIAVRNILYYGITINFVDKESAEKFKKQFQAICTITDCKTDNEEDKNFLFLMFNSLMTRKEIKEAFGPNLNIVKFFEDNETGESDTD